jgi:Sigma-70 region 2
MNAAVAAYKETVEKLARPFVGRNNAEEDDLVQEGLIFVWQSLERGVCPSGEMIQNRMKDWASYLGYLNGKGSRDSIPYEVLLPLEVPSSPGSPVTVGDLSAARRDEAGE